MNFHDCRVYAWGFEPDNNQLLIDVDYIFEWIKNEENTYTFKVAPCTFVFENVWNLSIDIGMNMDLIINDIEIKNPVIPRNINYLSKEVKEYDWKIDFLQGK